DLLTLPWRERRPRPEGPALDDGRDATAIRQHRARQHAGAAREGHAAVPRPAQRRRRGGAERLPRGACQRGLPGPHRGRRLVASAMGTKVGREMQKVIKWVALAAVGAMAAGCSGPAADAPDPVVAEMRDRILIEELLWRYARTLDSADA